MAPRLSASYHAYHSSPAWTAVKARHWRHPLTLKSCVVCGARKPERPLDMHELLYRTVKREDGKREMVDPPWWAVVPACAHPCHRLVITPLSRAPGVRAVLLVALGVAAIYLGAPIVWTVLAVAGLLALPRIPEATALAFLLGLPFRLVRMLSRMARGRSRR